MVSDNFQMQEMLKECYTKKVQICLFTMVRERERKSFSKCRASAIKSVH